MVVNFAEMEHCRKAKHRISYALLSAWHGSFLQLIAQVLQTATVEVTQLQKGKHQCKQKCEYWVKTSWMVELLLYIPEVGRL